MSIAAAKIDTIDAAWREAQAKEITELKAIIDVQRLAMIELNDLKSELKVKTALVRDLTNATDTWSHHFNELSELADENLKELEDLRLKNTQLKAWLLRLHKSKREMAISYSSDMRTLRAIEDRYSASYAEHIRNTPLPE
jgi:cell shape-determining protein MreC